MQLLLLLALWWTARHRLLADFFTGEGLLLVTAGVFLLMLSLCSNTQIRIRHILPVLVIFVILSGGALADCLRFPMATTGSTVWMPAMGRGFRRELLSA